MNIIEINSENAKHVASLMHNIKPEWWPTCEEAYNQLTNIEESIGTTGWFLADEDGTPIGWALFRELKCYLSLELECSGFNDNGLFKLEHKLKDLFDKATEYAISKGYTTIRTGMSSVDFNIDGLEINNISEAISSLETNRIDYHWLLDYGFKVIGIHPNAYRNNSHLILLAKIL
ncbi:MAG: hypothetical protein SPH32_08620 [Erysipelotrichaceae bacterium]|nr:hypothetical protein [Erysipelotrichaceae bacterium]